MTLPPRMALPLATLLAACAAGQAGPRPDSGQAIPVVAPGEAEAEARAADRAFSGAAVAHDAAAFASFLAADAVFVGRGGVVAGVAAVCTSWAPLLAPGGPTLSWTPDAARSSSGGDLVMTRGAFAFRPIGGGAPRSGRYVTVWRREADGKLRVVLDGSDTPLPPGSSRAGRRPLRRVESADARLGAVAGLLLDGSREVGGFLLVEVREEDGWRVLIEAGWYHPDGPEAAGPSQIRVSLASRAMAGGPLRRSKRAGCTSMVTKRPRMAWLISCSVTRRGPGPGGSSVEKQRMKRSEPEAVTSASDPA
jgi:ketosteroid isomerase-like protein